MGKGDNLDTGPKPKPQKKFVSTKQKLAAKKLAKKKALRNANQQEDHEHSRTRPGVPPSSPITADKLFDNDSIFNSTFGSASLRTTPPPKTNSEVRRPGWNRPAPDLPLLPDENVFGATKPRMAYNTRNIRMLKIALGIVGGIALLAGLIASILYVSKKHRKQKRQNKQRARNEQINQQGQQGHPGPQGPHGVQGQHCAQVPQGPPRDAQYMQNQTREYSQYPPNGWNNPMGPYGNQGQNYSQLPFPAQNQQYYQMQYDQYGQPVMTYPQGYYPEMLGYDEMALNAYYQQYFDQFGGMMQYPESQAAMSEAGFDPILNYVETIGDELKTPKRRPKQRKEGSSTPHPIITRRASCRSIKSEISAWTEDEDNISRKAESTYICNDNDSLKGSCSGKDETNSRNLKSDCESTKSSPQLSQTNDSAYGSRGSIQLPNRKNSLVIPPYRPPSHDGSPIPVQSHPLPCQTPSPHTMSQYIASPVPDLPKSAQTSLNSTGHRKEVSFDDSPKEEEPEIES